MRRRARHVAADALFYVGLLLVVLGMFDLFWFYDGYQHTARAGIDVREAAERMIHQPKELRTEKEHKVRRCVSTRAGRELAADSLGELCFMAVLYVATACLKDMSMLTSSLIFSSSRIRLSED